MSQMSQMSKMSNASAEWRVNEQGEGPAIIRITFGILKPLIPHSSV